VLRNQNGHALTHIRSRQTPLHAEPSCSFSELPGEIADRKIKLCRVELHAHQESVGVVVAVLVRMQDVTAVLRDESGNGGDDALAVGAAEEKYGGFLHCMDFSAFVLCGSKNWKPASAQVLKANHETSSFECP